MSARTEDCIVMLPVGSRRGSVKMLSVRTGKLVTRDQFKLLPMPSTVIVRLNKMAAKEGRKPAVRTNMVYDTERVLQKTNGLTYVQPISEPLGDIQDDPADFTEGYTVGQLADNDIESQPEDVFPDVQYSAEDVENGIRAMDEQSALEDLSPPATVFDDADFDVGPLVEFYEPAVNINDQRDASVPVTPPQSGTRSQPRVSSRNSSVREALPPLKRNVTDYYKSGDTVVLADEYAMHISVKEALRTRGAEAERVIFKELAQMRDKKVWTPVRISSLTNTEIRCIIRSQMFLKEKYLPTGEFEKLKARLVAGENQQDKELYDDLSSPIVSTCAVMTVFSIAAYEKRNAVVVNIGGAFLNTDMDTGIDVYMRLDRTMSDMMIRFDTDDTPMKRVT